MLNKKITMASHNKIDTYIRGVNILLYNIAPYMLSEEANKSKDIVIAWADSVLVTDESKLCDFLNEEDTLFLLTSSRVLTGDINSFIWELGKQIEDHLSKI